MKVLLIITVALLLTGCSTHPAVYDIDLIEVERPESAIEKHGEPKIFLAGRESGKEYWFEDEMIKIMWTANSEKFHFTLTNKTNRPIQLIWEDAGYLNEKSIDYKIVHSGIKYIDRNNYHPPTTVREYTTISDIIIPADNIYYDYGLGGGWRLEPLFPKSNYNSEMDLSEDARQITGSTVQVLLPLQIEDAVNDYIFKFEVYGITIK